LAAAEAAAITNSDTITITIPDATPTISKSRHTEDSLDLPSIPYCRDTDFPEDECCCIWDGA
jgi:hypothetical protein